MTSIYDYQLVKKLPTPIPPGPSNHLPAHHHVSVNTLEDTNPAPLPHQPNPPHGGERSHANQTLKS